MNTTRVISVLHYIHGCILSTYEVDTCVVTLSTYMQTDWVDMNYLRHSYPFNCSRASNLPPGPFNFVINVYVLGIWGCTKYLTRSLFFGLYFTTRTYYAPGCVGRT